MALQNDIYEWSRDHRVHHKFSETNADPHNANRGFFFSHMGWLLLKKHNDVKSKGKCDNFSNVFLTFNFHQDIRHSISNISIVWVIPSFHTFFNHSIIKLSLHKFFLNKNFLFLCKESKVKTFSLFYEWKTSNWQKKHF